MNDALDVLNPQTMETLEKLAKNISTSSLIPDSLKGKPGDCLVVLMTGAELGLQPMQALRSIAVVKGKPSLSADLMVSLVKQRKDVCEFLSLVKSTPEIATYRAKRVGEPEPTEMSFTMQDATRAGLTGSGGMYAKYPAQMLRARAASGICRAVFPDLCMGLYDSDSGELTDGRTTTEKDVSPPPTKGAEAVRAALAVLPAKPQLKALPETVDGEMEDVTAQVVKAEPKKPRASGTKPHGEWTVEKLSGRLDTLGKWLARVPSENEHRTAVELEMSILELELSKRQASGPPTLEADAGASAAEVQ